VGTNNGLSVLRFLGVPGVGAVFDATSPSREGLTWHIALVEANVFHLSRLEDLKRKIEQKIAANARLASLSSQIKLDLTFEGLRIQIIDEDKRPMFASGSADVVASMRELLREIGSVLGEVPNRLTLEGHTDLALEGRKFSGNAQRRKRSVLLFHGTVLHHFDLTQLARFLRFPSAQPDYRAGRPHLDFVRNLHCDATSIREAICQEWEAKPSNAELPHDRFEEAMEQRYRRTEWHLRS
jgi:hypothetical protein